MSVISEFVLLSMDSQPNHFGGSRLADRTGQPATLEDLPVDVLVHIFSALPQLQDKCAWSMLCRKTLAASTDPTGWSRLELGELAQGVDQPCLAVTDVKPVVLNTGTGKLL